MLVSPVDESRITEIIEAGGRGGRLHQTVRIRDRPNPRGHEFPAIQLSVIGLPGRAMARAGTCNSLSLRSSPSSRRQKLKVSCAWIRRGGTMAPIQESGKADD